MTPFITKLKSYSFRHWLGCGLLGFVLATWPQGDGMSLTGTYYYLGFPIPSASVKLGVMDGVSKPGVHISYGAMLLLTGLLWTVVVHHASRLMAWARAKPTWTGALTQALLAMVTIALVLGFPFFAAPLINDWLLMDIGLPGLEKASELSARWVPFAWAALPLAGSAIVLFEGRKRSGWLRSFHVLGSLAFVGALVASLPLLNWQCSQFSQMADFAKNEQLHPNPRHK